MSHTMCSVCTKPVLKALSLFAPLVVAIAVYSQLKTYALK